MMQIKATQTSYDYEFAASERKYGKVVVAQTNKHTEKVVKSAVCIARFS
jgi:hypothetical protein